VRSVSGNEEYSVPAVDYKGTLWDNSLDSIVRVTI